MAKAIAVTETQTTPQWRQQPERFWTFLRDVRSEMRKVVTPSREEVQSTTTVVIITVFCSRDISGWWTEYLTAWSSH